MDRTEVVLYCTVPCKNSAVWTVQSTVCTVQYCTAHRIAWLGISALPLTPLRYVSYCCYDNLVWKDTQLGLMHREFQNARLKSECGHLQDISHLDKRRKL